jgi:hypothetical protein
MGRPVAMTSRKANIHRNPEHTKNTSTKGSGAKYKARNCSFSAADIIVEETYFGVTLLLLAFFFVILPALTYFWSLVAARLAPLSVLL